jgi:hypothetical protein
MTSGPRVRFERVMLSTAAGQLTNGQTGPGNRATLAGFWPHSGAPLCRLLCIAEQHFSRLTGV